VSAVLPSGLVAILMTDVVGSSRAWNERPSEMDSALAALDADICGIVDGHGGTVVKARGEGDSHFAVFTTASLAIVAAAAIQRRADQRLDVRGCVVVTEAFARDGDYVGAAINHAARIRSAAHGGQVLSPRSVVDITAGLLPADLGFRTLGPHRIADIPGPVELHQLHGPGLRKNFPPPRTLAFTSSPVMAVVAVDEVRSARRRSLGDEDIVAWQRELIHALRALSDAHDGRHLKLLGDGCLVAFDDPRQAVAFARGVADRGPFRVGVAVGIVEDVEGELSGGAVFTAHHLMRDADAGQVRCCELTQALCATMT
jgi:class 3 adenylate cyclase